MLSQKAKYAIKALLMLTRAPEGEIVQAGQIAQKQKIPKKFLDLILFELRRHGMVHSTRGRDGGYRLALPAEDISVARVLRAVDGPLALLPCASLSFYRPCDDCTDEGTCEIRHMMVEVRQAVAAILENISLAQAARLNLSKLTAKDLLTAAE